MIGCSALRYRYRDIIRAQASRAFFIHLDASREVLRARLENRTEHFMPVSLLDDQLRTLEALRADENGTVIAADQTFEQILDQAEHAWRSWAEGAA